MVTMCISVEKDRKIDKEEEWEIETHTYEW